MSSRISLRLRALVLVLAALWLPLQTLAAMAMPLCRHAVEQPAEAVVSPCHEHEAAADSASHDVSCDNCELCHLACAGYMPSVSSAEGPSTAGNLYLLPVVAAPPSHIAEPPQHPPRTPA